jgi:hypothetical protein
MFKNVLSYLILVPLLQAFLILRRQGSLILSLFAMMISTGLPELSSEKDLMYIQETLVRRIANFVLKIVSLILVFYGN